MESKTDKEGTRGAKIFIGLFVMAVMVLLVALLGGVAVWVWMKALA